MNKTRIAVIGCAGRMGRALLNTIYNSPHARLGAAIETPENEMLGVDAGLLIGPEKLDVIITSSLSCATPHCDVIIDFSSPSATLLHAEIASQAGVPMVVGTTGFSSSEKQRLHLLAEQIPMVIASNFSIGVNLLFKLVQQAAVVMGDEADIEILEAHHKFKVDAPSGTALSLGEVVADALGRDLEQNAIYGRQGITGERDPKSIGFASLRGGDIVGEHKVLFAAMGERIEIGHIASSRQTFATGAVRAAHWVASKPAKLYDMQNVLDFDL